MKRLAAVLALLVLALPCGAQAPDNSPQARIARVQQMLQERPRDPALWFFLARFRAQAGDANACVAALEKVAALGDGFLPARELGFERVWDDPAFQAVRARLEAKLPRLDYAPIAFELDDRGLLPEGIAHDEHSHSFFVSSLAEHRIVRLEAYGHMSEFAGAAAQLDAVLGLAVDGPRRVLYAVSTSALTTEGRAHRRNAMVAFDVDNGRLLRRVDIEGAMQLNDVAIAPGGRVFTTDSGSGAVYEIPKVGPARVVLKPDALRGSNGIAASPDGKRLYVAHTTGIAVVDPASGAMKPLAVPPRENVAAIDGLYQWQGSLIAVENTTTPGRVILLTLGRDGESVTRVQTLLSHHHNRLDEPTTGAVTPDGFFLLAATGVTHYGDDGRVHDPDQVPPPTVLRIPLPR